MRTLSGNFATHIAGETYTLARLWTLTAGDGTILRFTDHDRDLVKGANTYSSDLGFTPSSLLVAIGSGIQGLNIDLVISAAGVTLADLVGGRWRKAQCIIERVNWALPDDGFMFEFGGEVTSITFDEDIGRCSFEVQGLAGRQRNIQVEFHSVMCRADLGDARCKVDINALKATFTVAVAPTRSTWTTAELNQADQFWKLGVLRFLTGANAGIAMEVKASLQTNLSVLTMMPMPFAVAPGDTGEIWPGCGKSFLTDCVGRYNNAVNFRGEPFIPDPTQAVPEATQG